MVVYEQMSDYFEKNKLLPNNQHGFRPQRSTMTAWDEIQQDWAQKTELGNVTGVMCPFNSKCINSFTCTIYILLIYKSVTLKSS